jgi:hypothetical protein
MPLLLLREDDEENVDDDDDDDDDEKDEEEKEVLEVPDTALRDELELCSKYSFFLRSNCKIRN